MKKRNLFNSPDEFYNELDCRCNKCEYISLRIGQEFLGFCKTHGEMNLIEVIYYSTPYKADADNGIELCHTTRILIDEYKNKYDCGEAELQSLEAYSQYFLIKGNEFKDFRDALLEKIDEMKVKNKN